jgi:putative DNA primase/helicase
MTATQKQRPSPEINRQELLSSVAQYIRRYLVCSDDQLTILALWVLSGYFPHTDVFPFTANLNIYSAEPQSGKTTCLKALSFLSHNSWFTSGTSASVLFAKLRCFRGTLLLDDRHVAFSSSERQAFVAFLNTGSADHCWYGILNHDEDFDVSEIRSFAPKAFAGQGPLPPSLASRCIPINLKRRKPSEPVERLRPYPADEAAEPILERLHQWAQQDRERLRPLAQYRPADMPSGLTPHQQDCAESLVHIADLIGGPWPSKVRAALSRIFEADALDDSNSTSIQQLLSDVRGFFASKGNPEFIPTRDLLGHLQGLEERTWKQWKNGRAMTPHALAHELRDLPVKSCLDWNSAEPARGYRYQDFVEPWERYLSVCSPVAGSSRPESADLTLQSVRNSQSVREMINVHAGPNTLTL